MKKAKKGDWAVLSNGNGSFSLVCFIDSTNYFWGQTPSRCCLLENQKIVELIGQVPNSEEWDDVEIGFIKKYYPLKESDAIESAGWISPDGKFYACASQGHRSLAKHLSAHYYEEIDNPEYELEKRKWLKLYDTGVIAFDFSSKFSLGEFVTDKQRQFIYKLMELDVSSRTWKSYMKGCLD